MLKTLEGLDLVLRRRLAPLERDERPERFVTDRLEEVWSPEQIAGPPWSPDHGCCADGSRGLLARDG